MLTKFLPRARLLGLVGFGILAPVIASPTMTIAQQVPPEIPAATESSIPPATPHSPIPDGARSTEQPVISPRAAAAAERAAQALAEEAEIADDRTGETVVADPTGRKTAPAIRGRRLSASLSCVAGC